MAKTTTPLTAQERVILFCTATGVSHVAVGITAHAMQSMAIKGFIVHDRESGATKRPDPLFIALLGGARSGGPSRRMCSARVSGDRAAQQPFARYRFFRQIATRFWRDLPAAAGLRFILL